MSEGGRKIVRTYRDWWEGRYCRPALATNSEFKLVRYVEVIGPPSKMTAVVVLHYEDGTEDTIGPGVTGMRPQKTKVEVREDPKQ